MTWCDGGLAHLAYFSSFRSSASLARTQGDRRSPTSPLIGQRKGLLLKIQERHWIVRILEVRNLIIGSSSRESLNVREVHDRLVELDQYGLQKCQGPAIVHSGVFAGRCTQCTVGHSAIEDHIVFLERVHREVVESADATCPRNKSCSRSS